jgi:hypothetical protein
VSLYTLFLLDWDDKTIAIREIECPNDDVALSVAADRKGPHADVEVMCGSRTVGCPLSKSTSGARK